MKKVKAFISYILMLSLSTLLLIAPAFAMEPDENNVPIMLSDEEVAAIDLSECTLLTSKTFTLVASEDGKIIDIIEGDFPVAYDSSAQGVHSHGTVTMGLYKRLGNRFLVKVTAHATVDNKGYAWWVEKLDVSFRPKNFNSWSNRVSEPDDRPEYEHILFGFIYSGDDPSVDIKYYVHFKADFPLLSEASWSAQFTLNNPKEQ